MKKLFLGLLLLSPSVFAASFDCDKAATFIEKAICAEKPLSDLDDLLSQTYKKAHSNSSNAKTLETAQRDWLKTRNHCADSNCIKGFYEARINELSSLIPKDANNIAMGRCHQYVCSWWKVENAQSIQSDSRGELIKASVRITSAEYSSSEVEKKGYPDLPSSKAKWENPTETFIFCSNKFPAAFDYDSEQKKYIGGVFGESVGATEAAENLYIHVCRAAIKPNPNFPEIAIDKPTDIFKLVR
jgi:uncharacterized protein